MTEKQHLKEETKHENYWDYFVNPNLASVYADIYGDIFNRWMAVSIRKHCSTSNLYWTSIYDFNVVTKTEGRRKFYGFWLFILRKEDLYELDRN